MLISGSQFNSGNKPINSNKKPQSINIEAQNIKSDKEKQSTNKKNNNDSTIALLSFNDNSNTYKLTSSYFKQQAMNKYENTQNIEKWEFAKSALGFSIYA